ncbi:hypothetical protein [Auritidibacter ignavus]|uniref:hypothetical protein n=1 Tax=Auritidibacter ignavus TaxID=678932 RepID=UPI0024BA5345|nr:hypothetical protein [Auritidibacter ignavus]WHS28077.1 hypothetical protein QM395_12155 [Auritidibacter ignavus]WHS34980.1 hypothetical protein QM403_11930 [Auritidibacter ignavus]
MALTPFGFMLRKFPLYAFGLDKLSYVIHGKAADFLVLGTKQRCTSAGGAGVTSRVEGAHPVLVSTRVLRPVFARQEHQTLVPMTLICCGSFGASDFDSMVSAAYSGIGLCSPPRDLHSPFG